MSLFACAAAYNTEAAEVGEFFFRLSFLCDQVFEIVFKANFRRKCVDTVSMPVGRVGHNHRHLENSNVVWHGMGSSSIRWYFAMKSLQKAFSGDSVPILPESESRRMIVPPKKDVLHPVPSIMRVLALHNKQ